MNSTITTSTLSFSFSHLDPGLNHAYRSKFLKSLVAACKNDPATCHQKLNNKPFINKANINTKQQQKDIFFMYFSCSVYFFVSQFEINVRVPGLLIRLPLHPSFKHLPTSSYVPKHLFHVSIFVPKDLVDVE